MARTKGVIENAPRRKGAGRPGSGGWAARYREDPTGSADIILRALPLSHMDHAERMAQAQEMRSAQEYIRHLLAMDAVKEQTL